MKRSACVSETCPNILNHNAGVIFKNLFLAPPVRQQVNYELDSQTGAFDDRFPGQNFLVNDNSFGTCFA